MNIVVAHVVATALGGLVFVVEGGCGCTAEVEYHHLGALRLCYLQTVFVGLLVQQVVTVDKLKILACSHLDACVASLAQSLIALADICDVIAIFHQTVDGAVFRAIINHNNLTLFR